MEIIIFQLTKNFFQPLLIRNVLYTSFFWNEYIGQCCCFIGSQQFNFLYITCNIWNSKFINLKIYIAIDLVGSPLLPVLPQYIEWFSINNDDIFCQNLFMIISILVFTFPFLLDFPLKIFQNKKILWYLLASLQQVSHSHFCDIIL